MRRAATKPTKRQFRQALDALAATMDTSKRAHETTKEALKYRGISDVTWACDQGAQAIKLASQQLKDLRALLDYDG